MSAKLKTSAELERLIDAHNAERKEAIAQKLFAVVEAHDRAITRWEKELRLARIDEKLDRLIGTQDTNTK